MRLLDRWAPPAAELADLGSAGGCGAAAAAASVKGTKTLSGAVLLLGLLAAAGCRRSSREGLDPSASASAPPAASASTAPSARPTRSSRLKVGWDPSTGRGDVVHHFASGDLLRTCFHCGFEGYTGGLLIGNYGGSGLGFYPARPIRGHRQINVICALDESIWDRDERREYTYGWSENFGTGPDGERLEYVRGRVLERGPERVTLASRNEGGCYTVDKLATTRATDRYWILATRVTNRCKHPIHFDFFTGDDPWLGLYKTAAGDVGWTPAGIVRKETSFVAGELTAGGLYDLGNTAAGEQEGDFTGQANFFALDPALPLPTLSVFANSFAHEASEIDPERPLDDKTLTALNLGWQQLALAPSAGISFAIALGLAEVDGTAGHLPRVPRVEIAQWSRWRQYLDAERGPRRRGLDFAAERVELTLAAKEMTVRAKYLVENHNASSVASTIQYPIIVDAAQAAPPHAVADGRIVPVTESLTGVDARFPVNVPARGIAQFEVEYTQPLRAQRATYLVTSALTWAYPIGRAELVVRYPASFGSVHLSYPVAYTRRVRDQVEAVVVQQPFVPNRELVATW